jgi:hypothetical protein
MNGCSAGSSLVLLTVGDLNSPALTMRMAFVTLRAFHEQGPQAAATPRGLHRPPWISCRKISAVSQTRGRN